ncbi:hypothetical protein EVAR_28586_1 [Eumeta japonica]|uniref:Uncharacterized protein n=1 Tax=Eumeta variegata TaxID=151549 RepID=A0A4C1UYS4_EUMVA|nr:hypothetical protein EVAR_28586_1 [Eumeta japonica]
MGSRFQKCKSKRHLLIEQHNTTVWRKKYLTQIRNYITQNRNINIFLTKRTLTPITTSANVGNHHLNLKYALILGKDDVWRESFATSRFSHGQKIRIRCERVPIARRPPGRGRDRALRCGPGPREGLRCGPRWGAGGPPEPVPGLGAHNKYMEDNYKPSEKSKWLSETEILDFDVNTISEKSKSGYILDVDLGYPSELHDYHNDYPFCAETTPPPGGFKAETYLRVVACRGAPGAYRFHTFNMVRDIFACRVVTQSVLSWRGLLATDCARAVVGVMARHGTTDKCVSIRRVARGANI